VRSLSVEVAAPPPPVHLWPELALQLHQAPDPGAVGTEVGLNVGRRLLEGGQLDAKQLRAPLQRRCRIANACSRSNRECYVPRPDGPVGHIGAQGRLNRSQPSACGAADKQGRARGRPEA
jgi:hypothetical protein